VCLVPSHLPVRAQNPLVTVNRNLLVVSNNKSKTNIRNTTIGGLQPSSSRLLDIARFVYRQTVVYFDPLRCLLSLPLQNAMSLLRRCRLLLRSLEETGRTCWDIGLDSIESLLFSPKFALTSFERLAMLPRLRLRSASVELWAEYTEAERPADEGGTCI
jgi:hypothetical protein